MKIKKLPVIEYSHIPREVLDYYMKRIEVPSNDIYLSYYVGMWAEDDEESNIWDNWLLKLGLKEGEKILIEISW